MSTERDAEERTEQASARRLTEAREKGQIPRSREVTTMLVLLVGGGGLYASSGRLGASLDGLFRSSLALPQSAVFDVTQMFVALRVAITGSLQGLAPFFVVMVLVCIAAPLAVGGWNLSIDALHWQSGRLNPVAGLRRVFGAHGFIEMFKSLGKFAVIGGAAVIVLRQDFAAVLRLGHGAPATDIRDALLLVYRTFLIVASTTIVIALLDVPYQIWEHGRKLRMSRQQLKEELKDTEGRPEVRSKIRQLQQANATRRMMTEVPRADVVITNPTHFAVALRYDAKRMGAPRVVAKGTDLVAQRIREVAAAHRICCVSAPPLARALFYSTRLDREIPVGLYVAVAQVLAYVVQLRAGAVVKPPVDLSIPDELAR